MMEAILERITYDPHVLMYNTYDNISHASITEETLNNAENLICSNLCHKVDKPIRSGL